MKPRPVDECLIASTDLIARTRSKLAEMQFSLDICLSRIEVSADAIAASQALLAKLNAGPVLRADGARGEIASEQTSDGTGPLV